MRRLARFNPLNYLRRKFVVFVVRFLTRPVRQYSLNAPNDLPRLKRFIRKGDVLLVEGNERISECIKYLTQSSWSHSALYVGDQPLVRDPGLRRKLLAKFGEEASYLVVEALVEQGVVLSPLSKYRNFNVRICRPYRISPADLRVVLEDVLANVGKTYDVKNVFDLARYFFPAKLVPARFGRRALQFGSGDPTRVICSSFIADAFHKVRFPILPRFEPLPDGHPGSAPTTGLLRLLPWARRAPEAILHMVSSSLVTPRDFDVSPYFEVVKFNLIGNARFDYRDILWADAADAGQRRLEKSA